jgi:hypothetical protein
VHILVKSQGSGVVPKLYIFDATVGNERLHQYKSQRTILESSHLSYEMRPVAIVIDDAARVDRVWQYGVLISVVLCRKMKDTDTVHGRMPFHQRRANSQYCITHCSPNLHIDT